MSPGTTTTTTTTTTTKPTYAIIGGGISGLTLAIALHKRGLDCRIYEQAPRFGEIGAGVAFTRNAIEAMQICDSGVHRAFEKVVTRNSWPEKEKVWFDFLDGMDKSQTEVGHQEAVFQIESPVGMNGVHRAKFLDEMVHLVPEEVAVFGKRLENIEEDHETGKLKLKFHDGSTAKADAVIGCDGIKSQVRKVLVGDQDPTAKHVYTHKYAYRGLIDMPKAVEALGEERACNACLWMGQDNHVLTFPINHGEIMNVVAFHTSPDDWPDYSKSTLPAHREEAIKDFTGFGPNVMKILELVKPELDTWSIFDLGDHPLDTYSKGKICLMGDAAHATSPHHGAGAGFCIEDAAVMASILEEPSVTGENGSVEAAFATFTKVRKQRTQWLVEHSRRCGDLYEWRVEGIGRDFDRIKEEIIRSNGKIDSVSVKELCSEAKDELKKLLSS